MAREQDKRTLNEWAADYQAKHGHPPLIIGREYEYIDGDPFRLVEAHESRVNVLVESRFAHPVEVEPSELTWRKELEPA